MESQPHSEMTSSGRMHCERCNSWVKVNHGRCPNCLHQLIGAEIPAEFHNATESSSKAGAWVFAIAVAIIYTLAGLAASIAWTTEAHDWLGDNSSMISDPGERDRIDQLASLSSGLWVVGLLTLAFGGRKLVYSHRTTRPTRAITIAAMISVPLIWILFSIWMIQETIEVVDHSGQNWVADEILFGKSIDQSDMSSRPAFPRPRLNR